MDTHTAYGVSEHPRLTTLWLLLVLCAACTLGGCGDDRGQANGWTTEGDVQPTAAEFRLGDNQATVSRIFQAFALAPGVYIISFDFQNVLSSESPMQPFAFPDAFFASLIFLNDDASLNLSAGGFTALALFDLDFVGVTNVNGSITASARGPAWQHFTFTFTNTHRLVVPVFEMADLNFVNGDSAVRLDNIRVATQP